jgi:ribosome-associated heat shock protein Hsp15
MTDAPVKLRLDKWLWHGRFFKTRSLAARQVAASHVRVNGDKTDKPARMIAPGDVLTFVQAEQVRVVRVLDLGERRGPATEAALLFEDLSPPVQPKVPVEDRVGGRPTKKDRRAMDMLRKD